VQVHGRVEDAGEADLAVLVNLHPQPERFIDAMSVLRRSCYVYDALHRLYKIQVAIPLELQLLDGLLAALRLVESLSQLAALPVHLGQLRTQLLPAHESVSFLIEVA
jgi:hypothetical protein